MRLFFQRKAPFSQTEKEVWKAQWKSLVPPENRDVPVTVDGKTVTAFVLRNQFCLMLQDGLLMRESFFPVCDHFRRAGYHVVWLMRCTQDIENGYLKRRKTGHDGSSWRWNKPTTNFGRWSADNRSVTILLQTKELPAGEIAMDLPVLERVVWTDSDDPTQMVPGRTDFSTRTLPATPAELRRYLDGVTLAELRA